ncbi:MAG: ABC transporter permease [Phocaeicola sp.]
MDITYEGLGIGLLLLLIPIYFLWKFKTGLLNPILIGASRMILQLFLIGVYLKFLFEWDSLLVNFLWVLVMVVIAAETAVTRTQVKRKLLFLPMAVGFLVSSVVVGTYFLVFVLRAEEMFTAHYFIPIFGIIMGNMLGVNIIGMSAFYSGLQRERELYYYLVGNGATRSEAIAPFIRQALTKSFSPAIANMAVTGLVALPGTMIGQILGGSSPDIAIKYQIMIIIITTVSAMLSLMITLYLTARKSFDNYGRLIEIDAKKSERKR